MLKKWREEHVRRSEEVVEIWEFVLSRYASALKDELWAVLEQVGQFEEFHGFGGRFRF